MNKKIVESCRQKLASEEGQPIKRGATLRIALCYPNTHAVGIANLDTHAVGIANLALPAMYEHFN